jgi:hypothetical protein
MQSGLDRRYENNDVTALYLTVRDERADPFRGRSNVSTIEAEGISNG